MHFHHHYYRGKHYKKRFGPTVDKYKTQLIFLLLKIKHKCNPIFHWFGLLIHKHDEWWDKIEKKLERKIEKYWIVLGYKMQIIKSNFDFFLNFLYNKYRN